jgi:hypothetical protein
MVVSLEVPELQAGSFLQVEHFNLGRGYIECLLKQSTGSSAVAVLKNTVLPWRGSSSQSSNRQQDRPQWPRMAAVSNLFLVLRTGDSACLLTNADL